MERSKVIIMIVAGLISTIINYWVHPIVDSFDIPFEKSLIRFFTWAIEWSSFSLIFLLFLRWNSNKKREIV